MTMFKLVSSHNTYYILAANVALAVAEWHKVSTEDNIRRRAMVDKYRKAASEDIKINRYYSSPPLKDGDCLDVGDEVILIGDEKFVSVEPLQGEFLMAAKDDAPQA